MTESAPEDGKSGNQASRSGNKRGPIESQLATLTLIANLVPSLSLLVVLWYFQISLYLLGIVAVLLLFLTLFSISTVWRQAQYQFRSLHNLLDAIVLGDYSFRGTGSHYGGAFGELVSTINALARTLQKQRLQSEESQLLVQKVVEQIDVAIVAWDQHGRIRMINPAAERLLFKAMDVDKDIAISKKLPDELEFANSLSVGETRVKELMFDEQRGRYRLHIEQFIAEGDIHKLLFLTNLSSILRLEEKRAWRNLVRVLSHEINNSLVPLKSFSETLKTQIEKRETDMALKQELLEGMSVIGSRANSVADFVQNYHQIARLPEPVKKPVAIDRLMSGVIKLFPDSRLTLRGESIEAALDAAQIEQVLINLVKNAIEAGGEADPIELSWQLRGAQLQIQVWDRGRGISNPENLFTPYYTTKSAGSGIGLVFCQQVVEAHGGFLEIANRDDDRGCVASFNLPLEEPVSG